MLRAILLTESLRGGGFGHLTRCLSIAQAFKSFDIQVDLIAKIDNDDCLPIELKEFENFDWIKNYSSFNSKLCLYDLVLVDSYSADKSIFQDISESHSFPVYLDDNQRMNYPRGVIINGAIGAKDEWYPEHIEFTKLIGVQFIPLRNEFWKVEPKNNLSTNNMLISFGGQDIRNLTFPVLNRLSNRFPNWNFHVVSNNSEGSLTLQSPHDDRVFYHDKLTAPEIIELLDQCSICLTTGGQTTYEVNRMGVPMIAIGVAENQTQNLNGWRESGVLEEILWYDDPNLMEKIETLIVNFSISRTKPKVFVDGQGALRIVSAILNLKSGF